MNDQYRYLQFSHSMTVSQTLGTMWVSHRGKPIAFPASRKDENPSHKTNPSKSIREATAQPIPLPRENPSKTIDSAAAIDELLKAAIASSSQCAALTVPELVPKPE